VNYRRLGRSGLKVSEISLGNWLTQGRTLDQAATNAIVHRAIDLGINFFDTADVYHQGAGETALGEALTGALPRREIVIATKCFFPFGHSVNDRGLSRKHITESIHDSLIRLKTDYADILQCHRWDPETPLEETVSAMGDLVRQGKILYWGVSEWSASQISQAVHLSRQMGVSSPISNQPQYHMLNRHIEAEVIPTCDFLGLGQVVFSPLAQGILTGKYKPGQPVPEGTRAADSTSNQFMGWLMTETNLEKVAVMSEWAKELGLTMSQLALKWILRNPGVSSCIVGASRPEQLDENAAASGEHLDSEVIHKIESLVSAKG
jgi:voltage-dependent potassium channel beta subunit